MSLELFTLDRVAGASIYALALFAHILGALALFIGIGLEWATLTRLRRAQTMTQAREWTSWMAVQQRFPQIGLLLLLLAGGYMTATAWGWTTPWILVSLGAFALIGALGGGVIDRRLSRIQRAAARAGVEGSIPPALRRQIADPVLWSSLQVATFLAVGVVFLMTTKPGPLVAALAPPLAVVLGIAVAQSWRGARDGAAQKEAAGDRT